MPLWGAIAGWHSGVPVLGAGWVPLLGASAGCWYGWGAIRGCCGAMVGAIAECNVPLLGAMLGCHCWVPCCLIAGVPFLGAMAVGCHSWVPLVLLLGGAMVGCYCFRSFTLMECNFANSLIS